MKEPKVDFSDAICTVKGYRYSFLVAFGVFGVFISALALGIFFGNRLFASLTAQIIVGVVLSAINAGSLALLIYEIIAGYKISNRVCIAFFKDGVTVYVNKPKIYKGYRHYSFDEITDYGFIHVLRTSGSGETLLMFKTKKHSSRPYLKGDLMNYGFMRLTDKYGGYFNVPVGDIDTAKDYFKTNTQIEEFVYIRIAGIHDDVIIPLK